MPRIARHTPGGIVFHVLNRANGRLRLFKHERDFLAFEQVLLEAHRLVPIRILDWCVMGNHWHFALWPRHDTEVTQFMRWLTLTHAQRWKHAHAAVGWGHLYQGRFKSLPVQEDLHLLMLLRYVLRNPVAAKLARRAQDWRWSSLWVRSHAAELKELNAILLPKERWPLDLPRNWLELVNTPLPQDRQRTIQTAIERGRPFGTDAWTKRMATRLRLEQTLRPRGRPLGSQSAKPAPRARA